MHKLLMVLMIIVGLVSAWFIPDLCAQEVVVGKINYPLDPMLTQSYNLCVRDLPEPYDPKGKVDPFITLAQWDEMSKPKPEVVVIPKFPDTPLTRLDVQQYDLTSIILGESFKWAFFTSQAGKGRAYKGKEGDFIGKEGAKIKSIDHGEVELTNGQSIKKNRW